MISKWDWKDYSQLFGALALGFFGGMIVFVVVTYIGRGVYQVEVGKPIVIVGTALGVVFAFLYVLAKSIANKHHCK